MNGKTNLFPQATRQRITDQLISHQAAYLSTDPGQPKRIDHQLKGATAHERPTDFPRSGETISGHLST